MERLCKCGSGLPSEELYDGHGIYLTRACEKCKADKLSHFRPDIMIAYETDEPIEPDGDDPMEFSETPSGYAARERWAERYDELNGAPEGDWDR